MRINVYSEELTGETTEIVTAIAETGVMFHGLRVWIKSPPELHHTEDDDDRSAVTFWFHEPQQLVQFIRDLAYHAGPGGTFGDLP